MNVVSLIRLFHTIYRGTPPDLRLIQSQGLLAIKIGQAYAQRADFLPETSCRQLARLYRCVDPVSPKSAWQLLDDAPGRDWGALLHRIDPVPFATASVGQVHRGQLREGQDVAVKIVRGDFRSSFEADVERVKRFARMAVLCYPKLARVADPIGTLEEIRSNTLGELNLENEVVGQDRLREIYHVYRDRYDLAQLRFPFLFRDHSTASVLVSEFVDAPTFDELLETGRLSYETLLDLFQIHGFYLFCTGTFHGDLHPGNVMLKQGAIYFLDTGAISHVPLQMSQGLFRFFERLVDGDFEQSARALEGMSRSRLAPLAFKRFLSEFDSLYRDFLGKTVSERSLTKQMMRTIRMAVDHGMDFETGLYPIIKSLMYLDGMVLRCAPEANLMRDLKPFLERFRPWVEEGGHQWEKRVPSCL